MKIDKFYIDGNYFEILPEKKNCNNLSIEVSYICIPKKISKTIEDVLRKYQISLDKILSFNYLNNFLSIASFFSNSSTTLPLPFILK